MNTSISRFARKLLIALLPVALLAMTAQPVSAARYWIDGSDPYATGCANSAVAVFSTWTGSRSSSREVVSRPGPSSTADRLAAARTSRSGRNATTGARPRSGSPGRRRSPMGPRSTPASCSTEPGSSPALALRAISGRRRSAPGPIEAVPLRAARPAKPDAPLRSRARSCPSTTPRHALSSGSPDAGTTGRGRSGLCAAKATAVR